MHLGEAEEVAGLGGIVEEVRTEATQTGKYTLGRAWATDQGQGWSRGESMGCFRRWGILLKSIYYNWKEHICFYIFLINSIIVCPQRLALIPKHQHFLQHILLHIMLSEAQDSGPCLICWHRGWFRTARSSPVFTLSPARQGSWKACMEHSLNPQTLFGLRQPFWIKKYANLIFLSLSSC